MNTNNGTGADDATGTEEQARKDVAWAARLADADQQWQAHRDREAGLLLRNKAALFEALMVAGISRVVVTFDGSGDEGQMENVQAEGSDGQPTDIPAHTVAFLEIAFDATEASAAMTPLREVLESLAYALLDQTHSGWGNGDGAYGEFIFDVSAQSITLEYNERYIETSYHEHEF